MTYVPGVIIGRRGHENIVENMSRLMKSGYELLGECRRDGHILPVEPHALSEGVYPSGWIFSADRSTTKTIRVV